MNFLKEKYNCWTKNARNGENLFFAGFIIYLFWDIMRTTMFPHSGAVFNMCLAFAVLILATKIFLFDIYTLKLFVSVAAMFILSIIVLLKSGYFWPFLWILIIVAAKDVPFRKILRIYLLMNITIMGLAFIASLMGIIENLAYTNQDWDNLRYSFGCVYTTDFAAHIFFIILTVFYLYQDRLRWYHYIGTCGVAGFIYYYCFAKLDTICILLMVLFFGIYRILQLQSSKESVTVPGIKKDNHKIFVFKRTKLYLKSKRFWMGLALVSMPVLSALIYILSNSYQQDNEFLATINETITGRLELGKRGLDDYGISLFGQDVPMVGFGGATTLEEEYFFIDSSYLNILLRYGILFLIMVFIIYGVICYRYKKDTVLMLSVVLLAISCFIDHHMMEAAYNPLTYALLAKTGDIMLKNDKCSLKIYFQN